VTLVTALRSFTVSGPVQAEIMMFALISGKVILTGPCGPAPWYVEIAQGADPMTVVAEIARLNVGEPAVVHSTSWRQARGGVVLTFAVVMEATAVGAMAHVPVQRAELVRGGAVAAYADISPGPVIEHGLRHLAWLSKDDAVVASALPAGWLEVLEDYVAEPFRHL
jgi:hypothetical protein